METGHRNKTSSANPHSHPQLLPRGSKSTSDATRGPKLRRILSAISPARHFCRLLHGLATSPLPADSGEVLEEILGTGAKHHDSCRRPSPPGGGEEASLCRLHHPCQCFKRESCLRAQTCLDRDVRCIFNSLKPETVLACRDSCSQGICLQLQQWRGWQVVSTTHT